MLADKSRLFPNEGGRVYQVEGATDAGLWSRTGSAR